jgi:branched-chain amino acid transport system substrate-binding protein
MRLVLTTLCLASFMAASAAQAQQTDSDTSKPYATLDRQSVTYRGPIPSTDKESSSNSAVIGLILPLKGAQQTEGHALLVAAQLAIEEEQSQGPLPDGRRLELAVRDESGPWGQASMEILKLFDQDHALAILTSANGTSAHLAEQIANKISIPILTLSSDPSTTATNIPWLFRLGPSDTDQARAFSRRIYSELTTQRVLLIAQMDHDGRTGAAEFERAAKESKAPPPIRWELTSDTAQVLDSFRESLITNQPDAVVIWADAPLAATLLPVIRNVHPTLPIFLCSKAAQIPAPTGPADSAKLFVLDSANSAALGKFHQLYLSRTGATPTAATREMYDAVHLLATALRTTGANRVLLRNYLAGEGKFSHLANELAFDSAGNSLQEFSLVKLQLTTITMP